MARVDLDQYRRVVDAARQVNPDSLKPDKIVYMPPAPIDAFCALCLLIAGAVLGAGWIGMVWWFLS